jgi:hypothetical protein
VTYRHLEGSWKEKLDLKEMGLEKISKFLKVQKQGAQIYLPRVSYMRLEEVIGSQSK